VKRFANLFGLLPQKIQQIFRLHSANVDGKKCLLSRLGNLSLFLVYSGRWKVLQIFWLRFMDGNTCLLSCLGNYSLIVGLSSGRWRVLLIQQIFRLHSANVKKCSFSLLGKYLGFGFVLQKGKSWANIFANFLRTLIKQKFRKLWFCKPFAYLPQKPQQIFPLHSTLHRRKKCFLSVWGNFSLTRRRALPTPSATHGSWCWAALPNAVIEWIQELSR